MSFFGHHEEKIKLLHKGSIQRNVLQKQKVGKLLRFQLETDKNVTDSFSGVKHGRDLFSDSLIPSEKSSPAEEKDMNACRDFQIFS